MLGNGDHMIEQSLETAKTEESIIKSQLLAKLPIPGIKGHRYEIGRLLQEDGVSKIDFGNHPKDPEVDLALHFEPYIVESISPYLELLYFDNQRHLLRLVIVKGNDTTISNFEYDQIGRLTSLTIDASNKSLIKKYHYQTDEADINDSYAYEEEVITNR
jgi:hypothetical protein